MVTKKILFEPEVTVLIPCYNGEKTIRRCLDSVLKQTYSSYLIKIIVTNDGSTDNTLEILKEYKAKNTLEITIIDQENKGLAESRNILLEHCKTDWFTWLDADDYLSPKFIAKTVRASEGGKYDIVYSKTKRVKDNIKRNYILTNMIHTKMSSGYCIRNTIYFQWGKLFKTSFIRKLDYKFNKSKDMYEDLFFSVILLSNVNFVKGIEYHGYNYVKTSKSMSSFTRPFALEKIKQITDNLDYTLDLFFNKYHKSMKNINNKHIINNMLTNIATYLVAIFYIAPEKYGFKKYDDNLYYEYKNIFNNILSKYNLKLRMPYGFWWKLPFFFLRLKKQYKYPNTNIKYFKGTGWFIKKVISFLE